MENKVYVIGGSYSLKNYNFKSLREKDTIVVNKAIFNVPNPNYFITMDFSFLSSRIKDCLDELRNIKTTKVFIANFTKEYLQEINGQIVDVRYNLIYNLKDFNMIIKSYKTKGIGLEFNDFRNGDNSGYCAFQLAVSLGYTEIYLLGIDLNVTDITHFHGGYGEDLRKFQTKLNNYCNNFVQGLKELKEKRPNIKVYICSKTSRLNNILPYKEI